MSNFQSVKKFMQTFGQEVKNRAEFPNEKIVKLRYIITLISSWNTEHNLTVLVKSE